jgi:hypothetical protein
MKQPWPPNILTEVGCVFTTGASGAPTREKRGREAGASGHGAKQRDEAELRDELSQMQPRGLKARACEMGVCEERIDATMDEDDVKGALIAVILEHHARLWRVRSLEASPATQVVRFTGGGAARAVAPAPAAKPPARPARLKSLWSR